MAAICPAQLSDNVSPMRKRNVPSPWRPFDVMLAAIGTASGVAGVAWLAIWVLYDRTAIAGVAAGVLLAVTAGIAIVLLVREWLQDLQDRAKSHQTPSHL